ncbi:MAG: transposase [Gammaproteobacteria bacterium]|nr:transposase [Gammaproteobacteria bacterium]
MLVDDQHPCDYHLASRCVRGAWLCGRDKRSGKDYSHRRRWLTERLLMLARCFAVEIYAYAIMSNHFHIVVHYDPNACLAWSDDEVANRWIEAFPPRPRPRQDRDVAKAEARTTLLGDPARLDRARRTLGSLSHFMKHLKQPIARRANAEDGCDGHFFEQRFYSGALLSEQAVLAAMAYVDLNPVRARLARRIEQCRDASVRDRLREDSAAALAAYLQPLASGLKPNAATRLDVTLAEYLDLLRDMTAAQAAPSPQPADRVARWIARAASLRKRQRAYGTFQSLQEWTEKRGFQMRETPLPA